MAELADYLGFGEVAEWFKAAVLKTASREHRHPAHSRQTRRNPSRNGRVLHPFAQNMAEHMSAQNPRGRPTFNAKVVKRPLKSSVVYFVQAECGPIKIGTTGVMALRFESLQGQSPVALKLLATVKGDRSDEYAYHRRFAAHRLHGEWFSPHPEILAEIGRLSSPAPPTADTVCRNDLAGCGL